MFGSPALSMAASDGGGEAIATIVIGLITVIATAAIMYVIARHG